MSLLTFLIGIILQATPGPTPGPAPNLGGVGTFIINLTAWVNAFTLLVAGLAVAIIGFKVLFGGGVTNDERSVMGAISSSKWVLVGVGLALVGAIILNMAEAQITSTIH